MKIQSYGKNPSKANQKAKEKIQEIEKLISVTDESSEIHKINNASAFPVSINEDLYQVLDFSLDMAYKTDGALNPVIYPITKLWGFTTKEYFVPDDNKIKEELKKTDFKKVILTEKDVTLEKDMMFDLGAVGKGFAGDKAIEVLKQNGIESAILDLGGNVQTLGTKKDGSEWKIGLRNPDGQGVIGAVSVKNKVVITSGGYERFFTGNDGKKYIHIFDGKTGKPVDNGMVFVTIVADNGIYADSLSTACFVMGKEKSIDFWRKYKDYDMIFLDNNNNFYYTAGLEGKIELFNDFKSVEIIK